MAEAVGPTLEGYLNTNPEVKSAREQLARAKKVLDDATAALAGSRNATQDVRNDLKAIQSKAQANFNSLQSLANEAQKVATNYFKTNYQDISLSSFDKSIEGLQVAKTQARSPEAAADIQSQIDALVEARKTPRVYKEPTKKTVKPSKDVGPGEVTQDQVSEEDQKILDSISAQYEKDVINAGSYITRELDKKGKSNLATQLNATFPNLKLRTDGEYDPNLIDAYKEALKLNLNRSLNSLEDIPFTDFLVITEKEGTYKGTGTGADTTPYTTISPRATATGYIKEAYASLGIDRDATPEEIDSLTKILNDAENRFKTTKIGGVTKDLLGNRSQFIANLISTGEYLDPNTNKPIKGLEKLSPKEKKKFDKANKIIGNLSKVVTTAKADTRSLTAQTLQSTARANGVILNPTQLEQYALEIEGGKDIKVIQSQIRNIAGLGMPDNVKKLLGEGIDLDTVYSPYKQQMAALLEINPATISFTDPVLRSAIGPNGEMPLYEFQKALRKDPRWEFTDNAQAEISSKTLKILQLMGLQG
jgi:hypothetical protein